MKKEMCPDLQIGQQPVGLLPWFDLVPLGVANYQLVRALPEPLETCLPTIEEIGAELAGGSND